MQRFNLTKLIRSFGYAFKGIKQIYKEEQNFRVHTFVSVLVIVGLIAFSFTYIESAVILLCIGFVLVTEMVNTVIENTWDHLEPNHHPVVKSVKDMMAAAVLISAATAIIVGVLVVTHHFFV